MGAVPKELRNHIYLGDVADLFKDLPDQSVDLIISSPPYNLGKEYESKRALEVYVEEQGNILAECARVMSSRASIFWQVGSYSERGTLIPLDIRFFPILEQLGLQPRNRIAWARQHGLHARNKFSARYETILWFTKSDEYVFNLDAIRVPQKYTNKKAWRGDRKGEYTSHPDGKNPGDIWLFRNVKHNHEEQTVHPCQFPEDMVSRIVLAASNPGDVVFDPYMGTGTVGVVARNHQRVFLGAEIDPVYHTTALHRLSGEPDENGVFPNLKTLREFIRRTGKSASDYRFAVQVGRKATSELQARIFPEYHHLAEMESRLAYEEDCFAADLRGESRPEDPFPNGKIKTEKRAEQVSLLEELA